MAAVQEVAMTSCMNDPSISVHVWDVQTGTSLMTYRGDTAVPGNGISVVSGDYIIAALQDKPFLRAWPINSQQPLNFPRFVCPGKVTHALASPNDCYIAVTVMEKLHIYQFATGRLVGSGTRHFQPIRVIRWSSDGSLLACGGEDGLVTVWSLSTLVIPDPPPEPLHVLGDHTLPVADIHITAGFRPRLFSVSVDCTCKIYDLYQGSLLLSIIFDSVLSAVTSSVLETDIFVGTDKGQILQLSLLSPPRHLDYHMTEEDASLQFIGHTKSIRSLSVSLAGELLISGSADTTVKVWHISSRQCLRTLNHKGPVTSAFFTMKEKQMFENELKPKIVLNGFKTKNDEDTDCIEIYTRRSLSCNRDKIQELFLKNEISTSSEDKMKALQMEIDLVRSINSQLYKFTADRLIAADPLTISSSDNEEKNENKNRSKKKRHTKKGKKLRKRKLLKIQG